VALLLALHGLIPRRGWGLRLAVGHVQHHLRSEAEDDAQWVSQLAHRLDLPFLRRDLTPPTQGNLESGLRRLRYLALTDMASACGADHLAVAHHAQDQLETLLMRLLRGASVQGMAGMAWRRRLAAAPVAAPDDPRPSSTRTLTLVRPLLGCSPLAARSWLQSIHQDWREDSTNQSPRFLRNRVRLEAIPPLLALQPDAAAHAVRLGEHLRDVHRLLRSLERRLDRRARSGPATWRRECLRRASPTVLRGWLRSALMRAGAPGDQLGARSLGPMARGIQDRQGGDRSFHVAGGVKLLVTAAEVRIEPRTQGID
jgi:tRNA(Ile)-lysidine synthetase-like protein